MSKFNPCVLPIQLELQVTAKGSPDVALSWIFDLQLGMARLFGQLCSAALDSRKGRYKRPVKQPPFLVESRVDRPYGT